MKHNSLLVLLAEYFGTYLPETKGVSKNTITSYEYAFQLLFEFISEFKGHEAEKVTFATLSGDTMLEYLSWLEKERGCSATTRNLRKSAISSFAKYAMKKNLAEAVGFYTEISAIPAKRTPKKSEMKYFTKEEIGILLQMPKTSTKIGQRDTVLMSLLYASGTRAQELCDITINDINFGNEANIRIWGKGGKTRIVTIPDNCAVLLRNYLASINLSTKNPKHQERHIFSSQTNEHMSVSCVEEIVKKYVASAKVAHPHLFPRKSYSPHSFRHSIAVHMLESGESLVVIKAFLGHSSITTTTIYASVTPELANRYLRERGDALPNTELPQSSKNRAIVASLPFLNKVSKR